MSVNDPLESELRSFHPAGLSPDVEERVAQELSRDRFRIRLRLAGAAAAAIAACLFAALALWRTGRPIDPVPHRQFTSIATAPAAVAGTNRADDDDRPSLAIYHRALSGPPGALDALLDRHASLLLPAGGAPATVRVTASTFPDAVR